MAADSVFARWPSRRCSTVRRRWFPLAACLSALLAVSPDARGPAGIPTAPATHPESADGRPAVFRHITVEQGLSDQRVQALAQDRAGFMWFGTNNGLNRYDGYTVVAYRNDPTDAHSISGNFIEDLYEDRRGTMWIGTRSGLNAFDRRTEQFTTFRHDPGNARTISSNVVMAIHEDRSGALWLGTTAGLNRFDRATGNFTAYRHDPANSRSLSDDTPAITFTAADP